MQLLLNGNIFSFEFCRVCLFFFCGNLYDMLIINTRELIPCVLSTLLLIPNISYKV